jgi:hypothetical protein
MTSNGDFERHGESGNRNEYPATDMGIGENIKGNCFKMYNKSSNKVLVVLIRCLMSGAYRPEFCKRSEGVMKVSKSHGTVRCSNSVEICQRRYGDLPPLLNREVDREMI